MWTAAAGAILLPLLATLLIFDTPRGLKAEPTDPSITAAVIGQRARRRRHGPGDNGKGKQNRHQDHPVRRHRATSSID